MIITDELDRITDVGQFYKNMVTMADVEKATQLIMSRPKSWVSMFGVMTDTLNDIQTYNREYYEKQHDTYQKENIQQLQNRLTEEQK